MLIFSTTSASNPDRSVRIRPLDFQMLQANHYSTLIQVAEFRARTLIVVIVWLHIARSNTGSCSLMTLGANVLWQKAVVPICTWVLV